MSVKELCHKKYGINMGLYCALFMLYNLLAFNSVFFAKIYDLSSPVFTVGTFFTVWILGTVACLILFHKITVKPLSYLFLLINSSLFYFIKTYNVSIDEEMLRNALETNVAETADLLNLTWLLYVLILGVLPCYIIHRFLNIKPLKWYNTIGIAMALIGIVIAIIFPNLQKVAPFVRSNKPAKYLLIPVNYIGAIISYTKHYYRENHEFVPVGTDARLEEYWNNGKKNLIIFAIGETARAANFSFNGYERQTNAPLESFKNNIINYTHATSCGTSTAVSVPCMFSKDSRTDYSNGSLAYTENLLDIMQRGGYSVIWLENNSDCKSVCTRVKSLKPCSLYTDSHECFDDVLIPEIGKNLSPEPQNTIIVMHQIGSHGPKYYKRYPEEMAQYTPVCNTEKLNECTREQLINTYDNTIYYTSHILAEIIKEAEKYKKDYNVMIIYASDHGESLGENNIYLHSAPYSIAPKEQTEIPFFIWAEDSTLKGLNLDKQCLIKNAENSVSHDNIFHSLLGISGIRTKEYNQQLDLFNLCKK